MITCLRTKRQSKQRQSLLRRFFVSYLGFTLLITGVVCMLLSNTSTQMLRSQNIASAHEKLAIIASDMDDQFNRMRLNALTISVHPHYKRAYLALHTYNEIIMLEDLTALSARIPAVDDCSIVYHNDSFAYHSNGTKSDLKLWLNSLSLDDTLYEKITGISGFDIIPVSGPGRGGALLYCFPVRTDTLGSNDEVSMDRGLTSVIFTISRNTLEERFTTLAGEWDGVISVRYTPNSEEENVQEIASIRHDRAGSDRAVTEHLSYTMGSFTVNWEFRDPYGSILFLLSSHRRAMAFIIGLLLSILLVSGILAHFNIMPIRKAAKQVRKMSEDLPLSGSARTVFLNETEDIVSNYEALLELLHSENRSAETKQQTVDLMSRKMVIIQSQLKNQWLQLLMLGKLQPTPQDGAISHLLNPGNLTGLFYGIIILYFKTQLEETMRKQLIGKIEQYSGDRLTLNCADMSQKYTENEAVHFIVVVVGMNETESMAEAREYVGFAIEEILPGTSGNTYECVSSPSFCDKLERLSEVYEQTCELLMSAVNGNRDTTDAEIETLNSVTDFAHRDLLIKRLQTALKLGRMQEAHKSLDAILSSFQFERLAFSQQRYVAYGIWNLLCETAGEMKISIKPSYTEAMMNGSRGDQLMDLMYELLNFFEREIAKDEMLSENPYEEKKGDWDRIVLYLNQHFQNKDLTLNLLSEHFDLNPRRISFIIKQKCGMNYQDYLTSMRIGLAQKLLISGEKSVTDICSVVGYSSLPHFVRTFKQVTGYTPTAYRESHSQGKQVDA